MYAHFSLKANQFSVIVLKSVPRKPSDCTVFDSWVLDNLTLADEVFAEGIC